ncbi:MAG: DUF5605 domain-containing protein, partial [Parasporobacterium sp.]|nr:DUF5605 domain-containing protein [Parasporobacterium sp.]
YEMDEKAREEMFAGMPESRLWFARAVLRMDKVEASRFFAAEIHYAGQCGDDAFLTYCDVQTFSKFTLQLPETKKYRVEVIDTWNMTRETVKSGVNGTVEVDLPGREYMAVLAVAE